MSKTPSINYWALFFSVFLSVANKKLLQESNEKNGERQFLLHLGQVVILLLWYINQM